MLLLGRFFGISNLFGGKAEALLVFLSGLLKSKKESDVVERLVRILNKSALIFYA